MSPMTHSLPSLISSNSTSLTSRIFRICSCTRMIPQHTTHHRPLWSSSSTSVHFQRTLSVHLRNNIWPTSTWISTPSWRLYRLHTRCDLSCILVIGLDPCILHSPTVSIRSSWAIPLLLLPSLHHYCPAVAVTFPVNSGPSRLSAVSAFFILYILYTVSPTNHVSTLEPLLPVIPS